MSPDKNPALMKNAPLEKIIQERFGMHRGFLETGFTQNSHEAIEAAIALHPPFIEFDTTGLKMGHLPQSLLGDLQEVLVLFEGIHTYPKIDIKPEKNAPLSAFIEAIDCVIALIRKKNIAFSLLNLGKNGLTIKDFVAAETHLASRIRGDPAIRLNIDLKRYGAMGQTLNAKMRRYVMNLGDALFSISPEIHQSDKEKVAAFAEKCNVGVTAFWIESWPAVQNPAITESTIRSALELEERYSFTVYFDINPLYVIPSENALPQKAKKKNRTD